MNLFRGNNIRRAIVGRGLVHSLFIYSVGIIVMVAVLYTGLMNYSSESGSSLAFQTSTAILPDLQDKNYYAIKRSFDQLVSSSDLKGVAVSDLNNKIFTKSGYWNDEMSDLIETTDLLTVNDVYIFKLKENGGKAIVRGVFDQNGIMWGKMISVVDESKILSLIVSITLVLILTIMLIATAHTVSSYFIIRKSIYPLNRLTKELDEISGNIEEVKRGGIGYENNPHEYAKLVIDRTSTFSNEKEEVQSLARSFQRLVGILYDYWRLESDNKSLVAVGTAASMVAHDIRKPLVVMKALLSSIPTVKDNPEALKEMISSIDRNIASTNTMLNDILEFSRNSAVLDRKDHSPQSIIVSALGDSLRHYPGSDIKIDYNLSAEHSVRVDAARMVRVVTNIIDNALDAMLDEKTGKPIGRLKIDTSERTTNHQPPPANASVAGLVTVVISDSGHGIPEEAMDKLFNPFFTKGKKGGTGLGLSICKRTIDMHGGSIRAGNRKGQKGAEFVIELPAGKERVVVDEAELIYDSSELIVSYKDEAARVNYGESENKAKFIQLNKERGRASYLLIVDDEPLFRESIRAVLNGIKDIREFVKVVEVGNAEAGLKLLEARKFDYVIADIDLGKDKMNGYEFCQKVLKEYSDSHILIHSNIRKEELDIQLRNVAHNNSQFTIHNSRFMGFLPKPMSSSELLQFLACQSFEASHVRKTILVLNDDKDFNIGLKIVLKKNGFDVVDTTNVDDALASLGKNKIDKILSDINLGDGLPDGFRFLEKVRDKDKKIPFYFMSGHTKSEIWAKAEKLGANGYLQQPFDDNELKKILDI